MTELVCWNCGEDLADVPLPISRQASCPKCFNELHCCRLCQHYDAIASTTCLEDRADTPLQKENSNFCEFFIPQQDAFKRPTAARRNSARSDLDAIFASSVDETADTPTDQLVNETSKTDEELTKKKLDDLFS
jgi:hypothetical protein